ncbi:uncharacterized protein CIMG_07382 [Coccidioides immitis RS]|uniref:Ferric reductase NAD binding domain-containing protein n=1 Tax=Coccidioides immitis (strain RS) TaxID=246410 RepID=J3KA82_COCIM|nr:uncharacterized protein CIMG_07382 [Coccidioides immitis RS]EAS31903.3 hypothetical protein CIMG_07382 [Coccidioides immitis RS]
MDGLTIKGNTQLYGLLTLGAIVLALFLLCIWRNFYEIFIKMHYGLAAIAFYGLYHHISFKITFPHIYVIAGAISFTFTFIFQMGNLITRNFGYGRFLARAELLAKHKAVKIVLSNLRPFTAREDFTKRALHHASSKRKLLACIDGPYSDTIDISGYGSVLMFATSIGIAEQIPFIKKVLESHSKWKSPVRRLVVTWEIEDKYQLDWVSGWMQELLNKDQGSYILCISIHYPIPTMAPKLLGNHDCIVMSPGHINIEQMLAEEVKFGNRWLLVTVAPSPTCPGLETQNK